MIILAGISVGMQTDRYLKVDFATGSLYMDEVIQYVFVFECLVKILAEEHRPWRYFRDNWNKFDFFVVAAAFMPTVRAVCSCSLCVLLIRFVYI